MNEELLNFSNASTNAAQIKVIGVGGGGGNAVNFMHRQGITDVGFVLCNTDAQALHNSPVSTCIQLGGRLTEGRGAGNKPELGRQAAEESREEIRKLLENTTDMVFITVGMGGGTGTGAAPVVAEICKELDILTIAVLTVPSKSEGKKRYDQAIAGVEAIKDNVDSLLVINNEKIREIYGDLPASRAFSKADEILATSVKGIAEIITLHGNINIDFADVSTVMRSSKVFIMGTGYAEGENRSHRAVEAALESPLLDSNDIHGTNEILLNITSNSDEVRMDEIGEIIEILQEKAGSDANIIWGNGIDPNLGDEICVTIIATGFEKNPSSILQEAEKEEVEFELNQDEELFEVDETDANTEPEVAKTEPKVQQSRQSVSRPVKKTKSRKKAGENWLKRQLDLFFEENSADLE